MAKYTLHVETDDVSELRGIVDRMAGTAALQGAPVEAPAPAPAAPETVAASEPPKRRGRPPKAETEALPEVEPLPTPLPVLPEFTPAPAKKAEAGGQVSYNDLRAALADLLDKKPAKFAQDSMIAAFGVPAISQLREDQHAEALAKLREWANG